MRYRSKTCPLVLVMPFYYKKRANMKEDMNRPVRDVMTLEVISVAPNAPIEQVVQLFQKHAFHHLPVTEEGRLRGIISKIDLLDFYEDISHWIDNKDQTRYMMTNTMASEVMTESPVTINADDTIEYAAGIFKENYFHALPVVEGENLVGVLTTYDIICYAFKPNFLDVL